MINKQANTKRSRRIARAANKKSAAPQIGLQDCLKQILPKNNAQKEVFNAFDQQHIICTGFAGTGKSFICIYLALNEILSGRSKYKKLTIIRSVVPTRDMGFLPGSQKEKAAVYETPYYQICNELFGRGDAYDLLKSKGVIEFSTTSFVRGNTFDEAIILFDEFQNTTDHELHSVVTRIGERSKLMLCGDNKQNDLTRENTGYYKFLQIAKRMSTFSFVQFSLEDVVRSKFVREYLIQRHLYEEQEERRHEKQSYS